MNLEGFHQFSAEEVSAEMQAEINGATASTEEPVLSETSYADGLYRIGDVPMYSVDATCRRSDPLQETVQAAETDLGLNPQDAQHLGLADGAMARVRQGDQQLEIQVKVTDRVPAGGVWLRSATRSVCELGPAVAPIIVEVV